jgi:hypothetical protein
MATTREDIRGWLERGQKQGATHVIVAVDRFSYEDYPIFISPEDDLMAKVEQLQSGENMQGLMEVYDLSLNLEEQLAERRAMHF